MGYAAHSESFGGPSHDGRGGLLGGYPLHVTREALHGMPLKALYDLPLRGIAPDPIADLIDVGERPFDGATSASVTAEAGMVQTAGEIKTQISKRRGLGLSKEATKWVVVIVMAVLIFFQVQSGYSVGLDNLSLPF